MENENSENKEDTIGHGDFLCNVIPGDNVTEHITGITREIVLGDGLMQDGDKIMSVKGGRLQYLKPNKFRILNSPRRYIPIQNHHVIGLIMDRSNENYFVDIGGTEQALLPFTAFHGATLRNRPNIQVGGLIFARILSCFRDIQPELTCIEQKGQQKSWVTQETLFGELHGGLLLQCPPVYCMLLKNPDCYLLQMIGKDIPFEIAVGANGRVWVNSKDTRTSILIRNIILNAMNIYNDHDQVYQMYDSMKKTITI